MIFFAASADTWKSQCGTYELAGLPDGKTRVTMQLPSKGRVICGTGPLESALKFCQEHDGGKQHRPPAVP